ncbi:MAG TPA: TonB-dependent receptor [Steroidobacteraceae bacterium]|nr:TonB-dependent receptor [Steroidobacteraceae bacterium]
MGSGVDKAVRVALLAAWMLSVGAGSALAADETPAGGLEEVVVTAQKREQNSQDVGISISALSGADLQALGVAAATDITKTMPAVILTQPNGPSSFSLSIRGVTQNDFADHQEPPAAVYVDDAYVSQMAGLAFQLFDIDRVEVLRGPQGTLFGRNATGGLAQFVSRRPTDDLDGYVNVELGERNLQRIEGAVGGKIVDGVDGRIAFETNHYDPLFKNSVGNPGSENGNDWALRGQLLFKLGDRSSLLFIAREAEEDVHGGAWESTPSKPDPNAAGSSVFLAPGENYWGTCPGCNALGFPASGPFNTYDNFNGYARIRTHGLTGKLTYDLGWSTLTAIADYQKLTKNYAEDSDTSPYTYFQFFNGSNVNQESAEVRLNGGDDKLNYTAGLYAIRIDGHYYEGWTGPFNWTPNEFSSSCNAVGCWPYGTQVPGPDGGIPQTYSPYDLLTKSAAAFAQVEYRATDLIGLSLGARFSTDKKDYDYTWYPEELFPQSATTPVVKLTPLDGTGTLAGYSSNLKDNFWSGKAEVDFHIDRNLLTYVSYNRGVKAGGFNAPLFPDTISETSLISFKPETLISYEVGAKSEFFERRLRVNGAAYYYDYQNYQALTYTGLEQLIRNANARHEGAELEIDAQPTEALRLGLGIAYIDAIVKDIDARGTGVLGNYTPANASKWSGNALVRYTWPLFGGHFWTQLDGNYLSKFYFAISDIPVLQQGGYGLTNFRVGFNPAGDKLEVGAAVENLANKHYAVQAFDLTGVAGLVQTYPGAPRWFKVHVNYHF